MLMVWVSMRHMLTAHVSQVPLEVCVQRDAKGLYALARAGKLKGFTGIDDPYEAPERPEITLQASPSAPIPPETMQLAYPGEKACKCCMQVEDAQGQRQTPEAMACTILTYLQVGLSPGTFSREGMLHGDAPADGTPACRHTATSGRSSRTTRSTGPHGPLLTGQRSGSQPWTTAYEG